MKEILSDPQLVAYCGLYCGACRRYLKEKCSGCHENEKATWCKIRSCCMANRYASCAECQTYTNPDECKYFSNFLSKIFAFILRSDRAGNIQQIKYNGIQAYADKMTEDQRMSMKR